MTLVYLIGLAYLLERVSLVMTGFNYGAKYNGLGAVEGALRRTGEAPMVYRVLVPWVMAVLQRMGMRKLEAYELCKFTLNFFALYAVSLAWGFEAAVVTAFFLPVTFLYDYWDWAVEMGAIALGMTGRIDLAILGVVLLAMSRETFILVGLALWMVSGDSLAALLVISMGGAVWLMVRMIQGEHKLYCKRFMLRENLRAIWHVRAKRPWILSDVVISLLLGLAGVGYVVSLSPGWPVVVMVLASGLALGRIEETRVFASVLPFLAGVMV